MTPLETLTGEIVDLDTGKIIARTPTAAPITAPARSSRFQAEIPEGDRVNGLIRNATWGLQSALFSLPDAATLAIGRGLGLKEDEVFTLGKFFNKNVSKALVGVEETAPRSSEERFARAIFEGLGAPLPFSGTLAYMARMRPMVTPAKTVKTGVLKGIADDTIKFVQQNPRLAIGMDLAFGAGYETLRQAVKENVSDDNPNKGLYEHLLPMAAFIGLPMALNFSPTVIAGKAVNEKIKSISSGLGETEKTIMSQLGKGWNLPIIRVAPALMLKNAEKRLATVFDPIAQSQEAQMALRELEASLADPRLAQFFVMDDFDVAERTMFGPLLDKKLQLMEQLDPSRLQPFKERINENKLKVRALIQSMAPEAQLPMMEAFQAAQAERKALFDNLVTAKKDLTEGELALLNERLGPANMDMINNELRGALLGSMEFDYKMRDNVLRRMGLRQATGPDGVPLPTRENGTSLFPARDMEMAAEALVSKYTPERPSMRTPIPEPISFLRNFLSTQRSARNRIEKLEVDRLTAEEIDDQLKRLNIDKAFEDDTRQVIKLLMEGGGQPRGVKKKAKRALDEGSMNLSYFAQKYGLSVDKDGIVTVPTGIPGKTVTLNPKRIQETAKQIAEEKAGVNINLPESLDYLASAVRFRNDSLMRYQKALAFGRGDLMDARRIKDTGEAVYQDIEKLILDHVPKISQEYEGMRNVLSDYRSAYEQTLPLIMGAKKARGDEFLVPNEKLMQQAFSNAGNLRQLQTTLGGTRGFDALLEKGAIDWLRSKPIFDKDGLVEPKRIRSVLINNKNIVDSLPESIRTKFNDEVALADDYVRRMAELDQRRVLSMDNELDNALSKVARPDADPKQVFKASLEDPALMRKLVNELGKDPERLSALRRSIFDIAAETNNFSAQDIKATSGAMESFIKKYEKSLEVLYGNTQHLKDLKTIADISRRVNAFAGVTGQVPVFQSFDETLRSMFGSGVQFLTTTAREAMVGRIRPETGLLAVMVRWATSLETDLYKRLFTHALENPEFANTLTSLKSPEQAKKLVAQAERIGISRNTLNPARGAIAETAQYALPETELPGRREAPIVSRGTAAAMLRALPPAPPTSGTLLPKNPMPPKQSTPMQIPLMYPTLFPNDPISGMLEQRRQALQQGQMIQPQMPPQQ